MGPNKNINWQDWPFKRIRKLTTLELQGLEKNARDRGRSDIAERCQQVMKEQKQRRSAERRDEKHQIIFEMLFEKPSCARAELSKWWARQFEVFDQWSTGRLESEIRYVEERLAGTDVPSKDRVLRALRHALKKSKMGMERLRPEILDADDDKGHGRVVAEPKESNRGTIKVPPRRT